MRFNLDELNLETLDASMNAFPDIYVNQNGVTFSKKAVDELGYPSRIRCQLDGKMRVLTVRMGRRRDDEQSFKFSKPKGEQKSTVVILSKNLVEPIRVAMADVWLPDKRYRVRGFWVEKTLCFDLTDGVQEDYRKGSSEE